MFYPLRQGIFLHLIQAGIQFVGNGRLILRIVRQVLLLLEIMFVIILMESLFEIEMVRKEIVMSMKVMISQNRTHQLVDLEIVVLE